MSPDSPVDRSHCFPWGWNVEGCVICGHSYYLQLQGPEVSMTPRVPHGAAGWFQTSDHVPLPSFGHYFNTALTTNFKQENTIQKQ